jgi:hypothetical protein
VISLTCTSCQKVLEIDDAFAGGVCRCQYCGTIQTVPSRKAGAATATKTLYQKKPRLPGQPGTGLEDLAEAIVGSSGLARGALKTNRAPAPNIPPPPPKKNLLPLFVGISALLLIVVGVLLVMLLHR